MDFNQFLDILLDALLDTAKLLPLLFIVYYLIEILEYKNVFKFEKSKLLKGYASPVIGASFGVVPQCGFSVISAELYSEKKMSLGALIAVFIATSDEALPIMFSNVEALPSLLMLIVSKFVIAIIVGYIVMGLSKKFFNKNQNSAISKTEETHHEHHHNEGEHIENLSEGENRISKKIVETHEHHSDEIHENETHEHHDDETHEEEHHHSHLHACCHHDIEDEKFNWLHPLVHSLKIALYIFIVNIILGLFVGFIGEENIANFLTKSSALQPVLALVIGFIPNCASSVIITELYMQGLLSFGSIIAGLSANAGLGLLVLFKENKNKKENIFVVVTIIVASLLFGYLFHFLPMGFLRG